MRRVLTTAALSAIVAFGALSLFTASVAFTTTHDAPSSEIDVASMRDRRPEVRAGDSTRRGLGIVLSIAVVASVTLVPALTATWRRNAAAHPRSVAGHASASRSRAPPVLVFA